MKKYQKIVYAWLVTSMLASCAQNVATQTKEINESKTTTQTGDTIQSSTTDSSSGTVIKESDGTQKELKISQKCVWCGHCIRIATSNFKMNSSLHIAEVISQENINWDDVSRAMDRCPVNAISIS